MPNTRRNRYANLMEEWNLIRRALRDADELPINPEIDNPEAIIDECPYNFSRPQIVIPNAIDYKEVPSFVTEEGIEVVDEELPLNTVNSVIDTLKQADDEHFLLEIKHDYYSVENPNRELSHSNSSYRFVHNIEELKRRVNADSRWYSDNVYPPTVTFLKDRLILKYTGTTETHIGRNFCKAIVILTMIIKRLKVVDINEQPNNT